MTVFRFLFPAAAAVSLAVLPACGPIVQVGSKSSQIDAVYTLSALAEITPPAAAGAPIDLAHAVTIDTPTVPGILQTVRVPVLTSGTAVQYLTRAQWAEAPNRLFQRLLADIAGGRGLAVIDQRTIGQVAPNRLSGQLQAFGLDRRAGRQVIIRYDATLVTSGGVHQRLFAASLPVASDNPAIVMSGLNQLANQLADEVAEWMAKAA